MRILVGTLDIAGLLPDFAAGFRNLGHQVTTVSRSFNRFFPDIQYDVNLTNKVNSEFISQLILSHDVFLFQYGTSLLDANLDFHLIKRAGKRIISIFNGNDICHYSSYQQEFGTDYKSLGHADDPIERSLHNLRMGEWFSDLIITDPTSSGLAVRPYQQIFLPLDLSRYQSEIPTRDIPLVIHAPSSRAQKGTKQILAALERLHNRGIRFDLQLCTEMTNSQIIAALVGADIVIDQLHVPGGGKLSLEGMACGCAVASAMCEDLKPFFNLRPIWKIDSEYIDQQLEQLLTDKALRLQLASQGRRYVEQYHDRTLVAEQILQALAQVQIGNLNYDYYPTFFTQHYQLPADQIIPTYLKRQTAAVIQHRGLPEGTEIMDLVGRGLISGEGLDYEQPVPVWSSTVNPAQPTETTTFTNSPKNKTINQPAFEAYYKLVSLTPPGSPVANQPAVADLLQRGGEYIFCGHQQAAINSYQQALALDPVCNTARFGLGCLCLGGALFTEATQIFQQVAPLNDEMAYFYLALALTFQNRAKEALPYIEQAVLGLSLSASRKPHERIWVNAHPPSATVAGVPLRTLCYAFLAQGSPRLRGITYFEDLSPSWIHPHLQVAIAPYFAFLFCLLNAADLFYAPDTGPLATTPFSPVEGDLYRIIGLRIIEV